MTRSKASNHRSADARAEATFEQVIGAAEYPCIGARSVRRQHRARVRGYATLGTASAAAPMLADLRDFAESTDLADGFASFVAVFVQGPIGGGEATFERLLWRQLQAIRDIDGPRRDPAVSDDPSSPHFSFSAAGSAYFVIGLHPAASRPARRAPLPMLVFNPHEQFEMLRSAGSFDKIRDTIRRRDRAANGSVNPMVADHGDASEAMQYSGRVVSSQWRAPFRP